MQKQNSKQIKLFRPVLFPCSPLTLTPSFCLDGKQRLLKGRVDNCKNRMPYNINASTLNSPAHFKTYKIRKSVCVYRS